jgi:hypothetical protein
LCWGSWPCLPPISLGWVVVGGLNKEDRSVGRNFPRVISKFCSSKLEASQVFLQRLQLFLKMDVTMSTLFIFRVFSLKVGCCRLVGDLLFIPVHAWQMYEHVIYMMNSPFEGWHKVVTLVWWNKNFDSCPNSTMKIFWVTTIVSPTSLEFKMLQEGFALM